MSDYIDHAGPELVFPGLAAFDREKEEEPGAVSFPTLCEDYESLTVPIRGVALAVLVSSLLWVAVIFAGRALWLLLR
jgi:hypothetical protein